MEEDKKLQRQKKSPDWFVRGILSKLGEGFDRLTGRNWKPASNLATSQLIEKLKMLLDAEAKDLGGKGKVVPHHIKLKMQWDKFSTDAEQSLKKLEVELLTAAIDHINDRRYHTYAPMQFEIKPDYFTEGVSLSASFDNFTDDNETDVEPEINVAVPAAVPDLKNIVVTQPEAVVIEPEKEIFIASYVVNNQPKQLELAFASKDRKTVGRKRESDLWLNETSVSKLHAALVLGGDNRLIVADTGSTNGTFVSGVRIAYGKAIVLSDTDKLTFGTVDVELRRVWKENKEEKSTAEISSRENSAGSQNSLPVENIRLNNGDAAKGDFPSDGNFSTIEIAPLEPILAETISPVTTQDFKIGDGFAKASNSMTAEKEIVADFGVKALSEPTKDEL